MNRQHIHLTASDKVDGVDVISGFRASCEVLIYIDIMKAIKDGFKFFVSPNNVVLCAGDREGTLPVDYFLKVLDRKSGQDLLKSKSTGKSVNVTSSEPETPQNSTKTLQNRAKNLKKKIRNIKALNSDSADLNPEQVRMVKNLGQFESELAEINSKLKSL